MLALSRLCSLALSFTTRNRRTTRHDTDPFLTLFFTLYPNEPVPNPQKADPILEAVFPFLDLDASLIEAVARELAEPKKAPRAATKAEESDGEGDYYTPEDDNAKDRPQNLTP